MKKKSIARILAIVAVCALFIIYGMCVRQQTIKSAVLVEDNGTEYIISFNGDEHIYTK